MAKIVEMAEEFLLQLGIFNGRYWAISGIAVFVE
jgi:hypothetical protein